MRFASVAEVKDGLSEYLARARKKNEPIVVTHHGKPYALIQPSASRRSRTDVTTRIVELLVLSPAASDSGHALTMLPQDPAAGLAGSDPQARITALEQWAAQREGLGVDPLTYALVDPDEGVRARAQELFEQAMAGQ